MVWAMFVEQAYGPLVIKSVHVEKLVDAWKRYEPGIEAVKEIRTLPEVGAVLKHRVMN